MMNAKNFSLLILAAVVLSCTIAAFQLANAEDVTKTKKNERMDGTYLITIETGADRVEYKVLVDPEVVEVGNKQCLAGAASGGPDLVKEPFRGRRAFVPLSRVVTIQQVD